jgi:FdhD protein
VFARTGGLHGACAIGPSGELLAQAEDVGRHNAVDKVVGRLLYAGVLPTTDPSLACAKAVRSDGQGAPHVLAVSGRASFEIVQKAAVAGFACVASVSAPSSLAVATAQAAGMTLASFVRDGRFTLYAHPERVR